MSNFQIWMASDFILLANVFYDDDYWFYNVRPSGAGPISFWAQNVCHYAAKLSIVLTMCSELRIKETHHGAL